MAVAETGGTRARQGARVPSVRIVVQLLLLVAGSVVGLRLALPVADVSVLCPQATDAGHAACVLNKAWLPAVMKVALAIGAAHAGGALVLWTLPDAVGHRLDQRRRSRRVAAGHGGRPTRTPTTAVRERRVAPRVQRCLRVQVHRGPGGLPIGDVRTRDASVSGLLLDPVTDVRVGETVWLTVHLGPGRTLGTAGHVTRRTRDGAVAVALDGLGAVDRGRLATFLGTGR